MVLVQRTRTWEREAQHTVDPVIDLRTERSTGHGALYTDDGMPKAAERPLPPRKRTLGDWLGASGTPPWFIASDLFVVSGVLLAMDQPGAGIAATALVVVALNAIRGLYRSRLAPSAMDDAPPLIGRIVLAGSLVYMLSGTGTATLPLLGSDYGRQWWLAIVAVAIAVVLVRAIGFMMLRHIRRVGFVGHRTLIVGAGLVGAEIEETLQRFPEYGLKPVAYHDPEPLPGVARSLPVYASTSLGQSIREAQATTVVVGYSSLPDSRLAEYLQTYHREEAEFFYVPRLYELDSGGAGEVERVRSLSLLRLRRAAHRTFAWKMKLVVDRVMAAVLLLLFSPLLAAIALAVRVSMGSPVVFRQERVGIDGRRFEMLKFRSLPNAPDDRAETEWAAESTRKPNRLGAMLRATSLDELPQLLNILRGDMSFVGPRPERPHFVGEFSVRHRRYVFRHRVPCGLTGLSQVSGLRGDTSIDERVRFDNAYVESWSLMGDLKILVRTIGQLLPRSSK